MSNDTQAQSGNEGVQSTANETTETVEANRPPEEYAKRLKEVAAEAKKYRQTNAELSARLEKIEQERLESQGKFQEIAEKERQRAASLEQEKKELEARFAYKTVTSQVEAEAQRLGCVDPKALLKLMDISSLDIDEDFNVDQKSLRSLLDQAAKEKSYLFAKVTPQPKDLPPGTGKETFKGKSFEQMSPMEKLAHVAELQRKRGA